MAALATETAPISSDATQVPPVLANLRALSFPLNVYAALLYWSEGRCDCLHYGLFDSLDEPAWQAQARASQKLWAQLPEPCSVLDVGIGMGQTLARLHGNGYAALGLTPEQAQIERAWQLHGADLPIALGRLEDFADQRSADAPPFDLMLFQESAQYIQPLALFDAAHRLLNPQQATLLVMDEFALQRHDAADTGLHLLPHFKAMAQRFGWRLVHEEDLNAPAQLTVLVLLRLVTEYRQRLHLELGIAQQEIDDLLQALQRYQRNYETGVYGYSLLRFERQSLPERRPVVMDGSAQADAPIASTMRALFQRVFGREMSDAEWQWKYGAGRGQGVGLVASSGQLSAFYGGLSRPLQLFGHAALGCQICDVMVEPGTWGSLRRQGPGYHVAASFLESQIGWGRAHAVGFGFPTERALGMAEKLSLYKRVDEMVQLRWPALGPITAATMSVTAPVTAPVTSTFDLSALHQTPALWHAVQKLWADMAADLCGSVLCVRDAAWLNHRYAQKPGFVYEALAVHAPAPAVASELASVVIFRRHATHIELMDVVAPRAQWPILVLALRQSAAELGSGSAVPLPVLAWTTLSHADHWVGHSDDVQREPLNLFVPANAHTPGLAPEDLRGRWFLTAGDTDFR